jgi:hypothetical protein
MKSFKTFLESAIHAQQLAAEFIELYDTPLGKEEWGDNLSNLKHEPGNCAMIAETFLSWLRKNGIAGKNITGVFAVNPKWKLNLKGEPDAHTATLMGDAVIDFNAQQFDRSLPFPRIISLAQFKKEWQEID